MLGEDEDQSSGWILDCILSRRLTDLSFTAAAGVSIAAAAYIASDLDMSNRLRKISTILYLEITIVLSIQAAFLVYKERKASSEFLAPRWLTKSVCHTSRTGTERTWISWTDSRSLSVLFDLVLALDPTSVPSRDV